MKGLDASIRICDCDLITIRAFQSEFEIGGIWWLRSYLEEPIRTRDRVFVHSEQAERQ
jgi:hypothetical protein